MATRKYIGTLGDMNPIEYGGAIVYQSPYGGYEMTYFDPFGDDVYVYEGIQLDKWLVEDLTADDWKNLAENVDMSVSKLKGMDYSDPMILGELAMLIGQYSGFENALNADAEKMTLGQANRKYGRAVVAAHAAADKRRNPKPKPMRMRKAPRMTRKPYGPALPPELAAARFIASLGKPAKKRRVVKRKKV